MNNIDKKLLKEIADIEEMPDGAYNIRKDGQGIERTGGSASVHRWSCGNHGGYQSFRNDSLCGRFSADRLLLLLRWG